MNELTDTAEESERVVELLFGKKVARVGVKGIPIVEIDVLSVYGRAKLQAGRRLCYN